MKDFGAECRDVRFREVGVRIAFLVHVFVSLVHSGVQLRLVDYAMEYISEKGLSIRSTIMHPRNTLPPVACRSSTFR